ncbi:hypothetical protein O7627_12465 [Solwaraspora sp. WMMD1047]|uniref:hypothetical protein n=1 Tax=Solwaraspora sp. WMMD1047 TaxID=3016102 RepID=UPI002417500F|nr:hypothetical protein [Solwaraspora sp. WMMD1047]MDG4830111.1 hypothetical protein [Solwaraspora sp. WMMD1047]
MVKSRGRLAALAVMFTAILLGAGGVQAGAAGTAGAGAGDAGCRDRSHRNLLFCEDFERLPVGGPATLRWGVDTSHGTLAVQRQRHGKALHVHTEGNGRAFLKVEDFAAPGNSHHGRVRIKVDAFPTAPDWAHFTLVELTGAGSAEVVRPIGGQWAPPLAGSFWGVGADGGPTGDWTNWRESAPTVEDRWQCFEWRWRGADNRIDVWIDGVPQPEMTVTTTEHGGNPVDFVLPDANTVKIGWQLYQGGPTPDHFDLWIDDIALGAQRVGCGR